MRFLLLIFIYSSFIDSLTVARAHTQLSRCILHNPKTPALERINTLLKALEKHLYEHPHATFQKNITDEIETILATHTLRTDNDTNADINWLEKNSSFIFKIFICYMAYKIVHSLSGNSAMQQQVSTLENDADRTARTAQEVLNEVRGIHGETTATLAALKKAVDLCNQALAILRLIQPEQ